VTGQIGAGRDAYAEVGQRYRYSLTQLHRQLPDAGIPERPSRLAVAVHGAVAGALLASWSKTAATVRSPLYRICDVLALDPSEDSTGPATAERPGNGQRGRQTRHRIRRALDELTVRGALTVEISEDRDGMLRAEFALPEIADGWLDPTYRHDPAAAESVSESVTTVSNPLTPDAGSVSESVTSVSESVTSVSVPLTTVSGSLPPSEKQSSSKTSEQASPAVAVDVQPSSSSLACSQDESEISSGTDAVVTASANRESSVESGEQSGPSRADRLAAVIPSKVAQGYPHPVKHLAAEVLNHRGEQHRRTIRAVERWLDLNAHHELGKHLSTKADAWNGESRSLPGLVLSWLRDLPTVPDYRPEEYAFGFRLRDAIRSAKLDYAPAIAASVPIIEAIVAAEIPAEQTGAVLAATILDLRLPEIWSAREPGNRDALRALADGAEPLDRSLLPDVSVPSRDGAARMLALGLGFGDARNPADETERRRQELAAFVAGGPSPYATDEPADDYAEAGAVSGGRR